MPYICNCAGIGSAKFYEILESGVDKAKTVYRNQGGGNGCGKCLPDMDALIKLYKQTGDIEQVKQALAMPFSSSAPKRTAMRRATNALKPR